MPAQTLQVDTLIIGGGIAGLWLLNRLRNEGQQVALCESASLGNGQTIASQGMIHGGIKYALSGALSGSSEAIADMPERWRACLRGAGDVDLRQARVLSEQFYMWSTGGIGSRVTSFFASKATRGRVNKLKAGELPAPFDHAAFRGSVYRLVDLVLDVPDLLKTLSANCQQQIFSIDWQQSNFEQAGDGSVTAATINAKGTQYRIEPRWVVLSAGEGNADLMARLKIHQPQMQLRPLHQALVKHAYPYPLYAHCIGTNPSPRLTISSHPCSDGQWVWYLGGDLATHGVQQTAEQLIASGKKELAELFPWLDFSQSQWASIAVNRAEPKQKNLIKPDNAFAEIAAQCSNVIVAWPTKLTLAPALSDDIIRIMQAKPQSRSAPCDWTILDALGKPPVSQPCWETLFNHQQQTLS